MSITETIKEIDHVREGRNEIIAEIVQTAALTTFLGYRANLVYAPAAQGEVLARLLATATCPTVGLVVSPLDLQRFRVHAKVAEGHPLNLFAAVREYFRGASCDDHDTFIVRQERFLDFINGKMKFAACVQARQLDFGLKEGHPDWFPRGSGRGLAQIDELLSDSSTIVSMEDRFYCEDNPNLRQLLPYISVFDYEGNMLAYQRPYSGDEAKLHAKWSIGFGGHVDTLRKARQSWVDYIVDNAVRELIEELPLDKAAIARTLRCSQHDVHKCFGEFVAAQMRENILIKNRMTVIAGNEGVDRMHLGLGLDVTIPHEWLVIAENDEVTQLTWMPATEAVAGAKLANHSYSRNWESWSAKLLRSDLGADLIVG